jgi:hypothetical protein
VLQIPDFSKEFTLVCDVSGIAISVVLRQKSGEDLAPIAYSSRLLTPVERRYSVYERHCLAVVYGCEKYRSYLEHKEFSLFTDNQALAWLLRHAKELGRIGRWVLRLAPFKFRAHISGKVNVVADCLATQYEEPREEVAFSGLVLGHLPEAFQSVSEHQKEDRLSKGYPRGSDCAKFQVAKWCPSLSSVASSRESIPSSRVIKTDGVGVLSQFSSECAFRND